MDSLEFNSWLNNYHTLRDSTKPLIMGILNITPDSFSDGGNYNTSDNALIRAQAMIAEGVDIIDIGGESTKPGALEVSVDEELDRVIPVIERLRSQSDICISIDTSKADVMKAAIQAGAQLINDISALQGVGALEFAAETNVPVCLMHMKGKPQTMQVQPSYEHGIIPEIKEFFAQRLKACDNIGISRQRLILDPGFGFGKTVDHNLLLMKHLELFQEFNLPMLLGVSRKSTIGAILEKESHERLIGGITLAVYAVLKGINIIRTHDVDETKQALRLIHAVLRAVDKVDGDE